MKKILYSALTLILGLVLSSSGCTHDTIDPALFDEGVEINGVTWATRNVGEFGKFAATPQDAGMFYQWNRKTAYSVIDPVSPAWDNSAISGPLDPKNDPCPDGWRMPTTNEVWNLMGSANIVRTWADGGWLITDKTTLATMYIPAAGMRYYTNGNIFYGGTVTCLWTNYDRGGGEAHILQLSNDSPGDGLGSCYYIYGFSIRCVKGAK